MGKKLQKYLDEAEKTEQQIAELEERLKTIRAAQKKEEDSEIIRAIRSTKMGGRELLALLDNIQAGNVTFLTAVNNASEEAETEEAIEKDTSFWLLESRCRKKCVFLCCTQRTMFSSRKKPESGAIRMNGFLKAS